ncbi:MAG TPA: DUF167 domain-containing protein [Vicinamibacterales bacterium]|nr:DUF167 domain-containing protein [Vicinamibacterales bacterium]
MVPAVLAIRVIPRSPRTRVDGRRGDAILIRLNAPPVDGAANDALVAFLSDALAVPRRSIAIVSGLTSRDKRVRVEGMDTDTAIARLLPA